MVILRALIVFAAVAGLAVWPASAAIDGTSRISVGPGGAQLQGPSGSTFNSPSLSADGVLIAYESASAVVPEDGNGTTDVFVHNTEDSAVSLVSVATDGNTGNGRSYAPSMSAGGRYVAFVSMAGNLIEGDANHMPDVFLRDRETNTTVRVSAPVDGDADGPSTSPAVSAGGTTVAFCSAASNLAPDDDNTAADAFVYDIASGALTRVPPPDGATGEGCHRVALSADGNVIVFSYAAGSGSGVTQVFRRDIAAGETVSVTGAGNDDSGAIALAITDDGGTVIFSSFASDLVSDDTNGLADVFAWQAANGAISRISLGSDGGQLDSDSGVLGLEASADGRYVVYSSAATAVVANDYNNATDIFRLDRQTGEATLASITQTNHAPNSASYSPAISDDGSVVAFASLAPDVVYGDRNGQPDLFLRIGDFLKDAGLTAGSETPPSDYRPVSGDGDGGVSSTILLAAAAAAAVALLAGSWFALGRKPKA